MDDDSATVAAGTGERVAAVHRLGGPGRLLLVGAGAVIVGTFLPWVRSGEVWRNSYQLWRSAERLDVVPEGPIAWVGVAWFLLPAAVGVLLVALALGRRRLAHGVAATVTALPLAGALVVLLGPLPTGSGPVVAVAGALVVGAATVIDLRAGR